MAALEAGCSLEEIECVSRVRLVKMASSYTDLQHAVCTREKKAQANAQEENAAIALCVSKCAGTE